MGALELVGVAASLSLLAPDRRPGLNQPVGDAGRESTSSHAPVSAPIVFARAPLTQRPMYRVLSAANRSAGQGRDQDRRRRARATPIATTAATAATTASERLGLVEMSRPNRCANLAAASGANATASRRF